MTLRRRRGNWSVQELERLRLLLPRRGVDAVALLLRRSADSVHRKAMEMLRAAPARGEWSAAEEAMLRDGFGVLETRLLAAMLGRTAADVRQRAAALRGRLRCGPWTHAERLRLKELYATRTDEVLEVAMQRSRVEIAAMAEDLCLAKDKRFAASAPRPRAVRTAMPRWTAPDVERLIAQYPLADNLEIARLLGRTVTSVANKAHQLGLRKCPEVLADIGRSNVTWRYSGRRDEPGPAAERPMAAGG